MSGYRVMTLEDDMNLKRQLFEGDLLRLAPLDPEKDAEIVSRWTHDGEYLRALGIGVARPLSPEQVKKEFEKIEKSMQEDKNLYYFNLRLRDDDRLLGFARISGIIWSSGCGVVQVGIGNPRERRKGFGGEALQLLIGYAFDELNLFRLSAWVPEYNLPAQRFFEKAGFILEVRRREALHRNNRRWDMLHYGLLKEEWSPGLRQEA